jgi:hypothetical protein
MILQDEERSEIMARYILYKTAKKEVLPLAVIDLKNAVDAMDGWLEAVKDMISQSSTDDANSAITYRDKLLLMVWIIQKRLDSQPFS